MRVLDAHLHLWNPDRLAYDWLRGALDAPFAVDEVRAAALPWPTEAIFVEAGCRDGMAEVEWVTEVSDAVGIRGIVAAAALDRGRQTSERLAALAGSDLVVGVRHNLQAEPDGLAVSPAFVAGAREVAARGWTFDACIRAHQLPDVVALAAAVPELPIVLDHLGKPAVGSRTAPLAPSEAWLRGIAELGERPNAWCKVSGLPAESAEGWDAAQLEPFLDAVLDAFGAERLLWGSDWPVSAVAAGRYDAGARPAWAQAVLDWARRREVDADALFHANAARFYGIRSEGP